MAALSEWLADLLASLQHSGPEAEATARYIGENDIHLGVHAQPTGARWRPGRRIDLHPRYLESAPQDAYPLSLVIHEVRHLQQGPLIALSVYGELEAWQAQFHFIRSRAAPYHEVAGRAQLIGQLMSLPLGWDRTVLARARSLMKEFAGTRYRIDLLPLYPLHLELVWAITRRQPRPPK
jgi:hypothetical protein